MSNLLEAKGIKKHYVDGPRVLEVLNGIDLEVRAGTAVSVVGASGTGKSTLLHLLGALDRPTGGEVILKGKKYSALKEKDLATLRSTCIGFVFQFHHLLGEFSALENVMVPAMIKGSSKEEAARHSKEILQAVGLGERLGHRPVKLSGGEQQRVALARALVNNPDIILADEPTGDLDLSTGEEMIRLIWMKTVEQGKALVIVTHDPDIAGKADRMYRLKEGTLHVEKA